MAGMDYGGRAFRNGIHMPQCEDRAVVLKDLPMAMAGTYEYKDYDGDWEESTEEKQGHWIEEPLWHISDNAVLGDGPVYLTLHRQQGYQIYQYGQKDGFLKEADYESGLTHRTGNIQGHQIDVYLYSDEDNEYLNNYYVFGRLVQPDGTIWTGFSGYCCGNGWDENIEQGWENTLIAQNEMAHIFPNSGVEFADMTNDFYVQFYNRRLKESLNDYWANKEINWDEPGYDEYDISEHENRRWQRKYAEMDIAEVIIQASQHNFTITISAPEERSDE